jgi:predicted nucleic acid-binding protein
LIAVIGDEDSKRKIIGITEGCTLCSPISVHWEIGNAFTAMFRRRQITIDQARLALAAYSEIPIKFIDAQLEQIIEISHALNIYAYDAYLIQCAQRTNTSLFTLDKGLKVAAQKIGIQILEVE